MTAPVLALRPVDLPPLTILVHPEHDPADRSALRVMRTPLDIAPWVPITGKNLGQQHSRLHTGVVGWQIQRFADLLGVYDGEAH